MAKTKKELSPSKKAPRSRLRKQFRRPDLSIEEILAWADAHHERTGDWPKVASGRIPETVDEKWRNVDMCLRTGGRGLPRDSGLSLARLLDQRRGVRNLKDLPPFTEDQILAWADAHKERTGGWPTQLSGPIESSPGDTWTGVDDALSRGGRGLPGGSSLPRLLEEARGARNVQNLPRLTLLRVLAWCDAHKHRTGDWPTRDSGDVVDSPGDTWLAIDAALHNGLRGLAGGSSLAQLLDRRRGRRNIHDLPNFTQRQIVAWAKAHLKRHGRWPTILFGAIESCPSETWAAVDRALRHGGRGLPGGSSLAKLLEEKCQARTSQNLPRLSEEQVLAWCDAHRRRTGEWPAQASAEVVDSPGETWRNIDAALKQGLRGFPGGDSLAQLLASRRGRRNKGRLPPLTYKLILVWCDAHHKRTGDWPRSRDKSPIKESPGDCWMNINNALFHGLRGLPGGTSLRRLLAQKRGVRNPKAPPELDESKISEWMLAHWLRTGDWPTASSGSIASAPGETWAAVDLALRRGRRGLREGSSLARLRGRHARRRGAQSGSG